MWKCCPLWLAAALAFAAGPASAAPRDHRISERAEDTVEDAATVLEEMADIPEKRIPPGLLAEANAVLIVPDAIKGGFVLSGRFGRGVLLVRTRDGWSDPIFVTLSGGGVGFQVGVQATDLVLVFRGRRGVERLLKGEGKVTLGADAAVAAGPVGRLATAATDARLRADILAYSRSRGLFAGVSLEGDALWVDWRANELFYHSRGVTPNDILMRKEIRVPESAVRLKQQLARSAAKDGPPAILLPPPPAPVAPPVPLPVPPPVPPK